MVAVLYLQINKANYNVLMNVRELTILGASLYACEGTKARRDRRGENRYIYSIEFTNSEPHIIQVFSLFLREVVRADWSRVRGQLFLYLDLDENLLKRAWSEASGVPLGQFQRSIFLKQKTGRFRPSPMGTYKIRYSCKQDFLRLQKIIKDVWNDAGVTVAGR